MSKDRGFSMRLMWREDGAIVTYAYYPDKPDSVHCGEDWLWSKKLRAGQWHTIRMYAKLNTVKGSDAKEDGVFKAWLDGKLVLYKTGIRYRYDKNFLISRAYITTYVGGSSRKLFAPKQDQHVWCAPAAIVTASVNLGSPPYRALQWPPTSAAAVCALRSERRGMSAESHRYCCAGLTRWQCGRVTAPSPRTAASTSNRRRRCLKAPRMATQRRARALTARRQVTHKQTARALAARCANFCT